MAPTVHDTATLGKRYDICYDEFSNRNYRCNYSRWDDWGRWVALAVIVICVLLVAFLCSCFNARRRRRRGMAPMYGTGWIPAVGPKNYQNNGGYYNNQPYNGGPAPPYPGPSNHIPNQQTGTTFNSNDGYYGQHNNGGYGQQGVELQPPQNAYHGQRGGDPVYEAPLGAPPGKGDGIVR